jgi:phytoene/squalene synthetase
VRRRLTTSASSDASRLVPDAASVDYCKQLVRDADYDNFLSTLLAPAEHRSAIFTVHAFNIELQQVRQQTHGNPLAARMRYQWWREVVHALFQGDAGGGAAAGALSGHPVVDCLRTAVRDCNLTQRWLEHILEVLARLNTPSAIS